MMGASSTQAPTTGGAPDIWRLRLFVAGMTPVARRTLANVNRLCDAYLGGRYTLRVVDLCEEPERAEADEIIAVPTLVRDEPLPVRKVLGDLSNIERALAGLGLGREGAQWIARDDGQRG